MREALTFARLPPDVVHKFDAMVRARIVSDVVEISNRGIHTTSGRRAFGRSAVAMGFGRTLCFNTRVNFPRGHVERAELYDATDSEGRNHTIMIPVVCGNVAVLGERAEEAEGRTADQQTAPEPATLALMLAGLAAIGWFSRRARP